MKKLFIFNLFSFCLLSLFISCEDDDVCIEQTTPKLTLIFQNEKGERSVISNLYIAREFPLNPLIDRDTLVADISIDSLNLPLRTDINYSRFFFSIHDSIGENNGMIIYPLEDTLTITYDREQEFVSKGCGFKYIYKNITYNLESPLNKNDSLNINQIEGISHEIIDQSNINLYIRYKK